MHYYFNVLSNYFNFSGRARRSEYWYFILFNAIFAFTFMFLDILLGFSELGYGVLYVLYSLAVFIPGIAVTVRRLHDVGKSGWMYFIVLIPIIGAIWLLVLLLTEGDHRPNKYGPSPYTTVAENYAT
ncbi:DUF805 domain-containing protein [Salegentibacter sp. HM20]